MNYLFNRLNALFTRIQDNELTQNDIFTIVISLFVTIICLTLVVSIKYWLVPFLALCLIIYWIIDWLKSRNFQPQPPTIPNAVYIIYQCIYTVVQEITTRGNLLPIQAPIDIDDICMFPQISYKSNQAFAKIQLLKRPGSAIDSDTPEIIRKVLQMRINSRLRSGKVAGVPYTSYDGHTPIICIDEVHDEGLYFILDVMIVDNPTAIQYLQNKRQKVEHQTHVPPTDRDF